jgi:hypothetical protein
MPTKHITEKTWRLVEKETVKAVIATQKPIRGTQVIEILIKKGIENITEEDYKGIS